MATVKVSKETTLKIYVADAFTKVAFGGNPAAICPLNFNQELSDDIMQKIAVEMNLSETAFISLLDEKDTFQTAKRFGLRWFTPGREVPLCGHATLATCAVLFFTFKNQSPVLEFATASGTLKAKKLSDGRIEMDFPISQSLPINVHMFEGVIKGAIGSLPVEEVILFLPSYLMIRLRDDVTVQQFKELKPREHEMMAGVSDLIGVIVTLKGNGKEVDNEGKAYDFFTRFFAPWVNVSEDPVCGSGNTSVTPYWAKVLNKKELYVRQCSRRGGDVYCTLLENRVGLGGYGAVVLEGEIKF